MALLRILTYPDPLLHECAKPVTEFDDKLAKFLDDLRETMYVAEGVGLAATQVGVLQRAVVIDVSPERNSLLELVNPQIVECKGGSISSEEGCLSVPDYREVVKRTRIVRVAAQDRHGRPFELEADDLLARCIQHELDHLDGVLFVDRISGLKKQLFRRWFRKHAPVSE